MMNFISFVGFNVHSASENILQMFPRSLERENIFSSRFKKAFINVMFSGKIAKPIRSARIHSFIYLAMNFGRTVSTQSISCF